MMEKTGRPLNLIRYASENGIAKKEKLRFTPRLKVYSSVLVLILAAITTMLVSRKPVSGTVMRTPGMLYQEQGADSLSNLYRIKLMNKTGQDIPLQLKIEDGDGIITMVGNPIIHVKAGAQGEGTFFIILPKQAIHKRKSTIHIGVYDDKNSRITGLSTTFLGPVM
jgi:polyferredoxin